MRKGQHCPLEIRQKISESMRGNQNNRGKKRSLETRQKISNAMKGENHPNWGKKLSSQTCQKIGKAHKGMKHTIEARQKMSEAHKGKKFTPEHCRKISEAKRGEKNHMWGKHHSLESRRRMSEAKRGEKNSNWKGGWIYDDGYVRILVPDHPNVTLNGYVYEHRLIMEEHLGRLLDPAEVVHHLNGSPSDNGINNLMFFPSQADYVRFHRERKNAQRS